MPFLTRSSSMDSSDLRAQVRQDRNRAAAIQQATLLQQRKDTERDILAGLEELVDFPSNPRASPSHPEPSDLISLRSLVKPFQVSDYDALLQERNIAGTCGYVFCPRPYRKDTKKLGTHEMLRDGRVMHRDDVRRWCSKECARRAMFIQVQLSETPAWERQGGLGNEIEVLEEGELGDLIVERIKHTEVCDDDEELKRAMKDLAIERGEKEGGARQQGLLKNIVQENRAQEAVRAPDGTDNRTFSIEGYASLRSG